MKKDKPLRVKSITIRGLGDVYTRIAAKTGDIKWHANIIQYNIIPRNTKVKCHLPKQTDTKWVDIVLIVGAISTCLRWGLIYINIHQ